MPPTRCLGAAVRWSSGDRKSTRLNSSHQIISYAVFCLTKQKHTSELQSPDHLVCRLLLEKVIAHVLIPLEQSSCTQYFACTETRRTMLGTESSLAVLSHHR